MSDAIVPDDKNWTWVLERECPDCGFDSSTFNARTTGDALRDQAAQWTKLLERSDVRERPQPTVWSPLEYACHVRDVFRKFDERLILMLNEDDPHFENWDQDKTAIDDDYRSQDPVVVRDELAQSALQLAKRFDSVNDSQWGRRGLRSDGSVFTIQSIAQYLMHDPVHHLWDVGAPGTNSK